jgi:hypothetical protein
LSKTDSKLSDSEYGSLLDTYLYEIKNIEEEEKERAKLERLEKSFSHSYLDIIFPYHMYLGKIQKKSLVPVPQQDPEMAQ